MKVFDQLMYLAQLKGLNYTDAKKAIDFWLDRFDASTWKKKEVSELSKGMSQKIQFIATVAHDPEIYIFDEPFSGLDPINSEMLKQVILEREEAWENYFVFHPQKWNRWSKCVMTFVSLIKVKWY